MPERPRLLDLFCGAGGAAMGYHHAGFDVVGIDINPQPHYPFRFWQGDALDTDTWPDFPLDAIHASPPCQRCSVAQRLRGRWHPDLIEPTRRLLASSGVPWVIENVPAAPLRNPVILCGTSFGLGAAGFELRRHRAFEASFPMLVPPCRHSKPAIQIMGHGTNSWFRMKYPDARIGNDERREAVGVPWMVWDEIGEAVPPAFTEHVGTFLIQHLEQGLAA